MALGRKTWIAALAAAGVLLGYSIGRAGSTLPGTQNAPVTFSGNVSSSGTPLTGTHQVAMNLWKATDTSVTSNEACQGTTQNVAFDNGSFQLQLDPTCTSALSMSTQLWDQLVVDGTAFPLQQVGSVPYALRSMQDPSNGTRLAIQSTRLYGEDGFRGFASYGSTITDTLRNETCSPGLTSSGGVQAQRCLPGVAVGPGDADMTTYTLYSDSGCTTPWPTDPQLRYFAGSSPALYVGDADAAGAVTAIYAAVAQVGTPYAIQRDPSNGAIVCAPYPPYQNTTPTITQFTVGAAIPLTDFVQMQWVTE